MFQMNLPSIWDVSTKYAANNLADAIFRCVLLVFQWVTVQTMIKCRHTVYFESQTDRVLIYVESTAVIVLKYRGTLSLD